MGVQLQNENKLNEMTQILLNMFLYMIQKRSRWKDVYTISNEIVPSFAIRDKLTSARVRGAATLRSFHKTSLDHLEGHIPVTSEWHARLCLVTVSLYTQIVMCIYCICVFRFYRVDFTVHHFKIRSIEAQVINQTSFGKAPTEHEGCRRFPRGCALCPCNWCS